MKDNDDLKEFLDGIKFEGQDEVYEEFPMSRHMEAEIKKYEEKERKKKIF